MPRAPDRTAVLAADSPAKAKALGRTVTGFDEGVWQRHQWGIVVDGSVAKFGSDQALRSFLLATRRRVLVEASPLDRIWGIGLPADSRARHESECVARLEPARVRAHAGPGADRLITARGSVAVTQGT